MQDISRCRKLGLGGMPVLRGNVCAAKAAAMRCCPHVTLRILLSVSPTEWSVALCGCSVALQGTQLDSFIDGDWGLEWNVKNGQHNV